MAVYGGASYLVTPWGTVNFNDTSAPTLLHDANQCSGLDMVPLRVQIDDKPVTDGGIVHAGYLSGRHIVLGGALWARTIAERQDLEDNLAAALESIMDADGTYQWNIVTETTLYMRSVTVRCEIGLGVSGGYQKNYTFGLVAADPTILENSSPISGSGGSNPGGGAGISADFTF